MTRPPDRAPHDVPAAPEHDFGDWQRRIGAFVCLAADGSEEAPGPLAGCSVAVKDVIDVAGLPTRNGSATCAGASPAEADAPVVARLRASGARIVGKTVTTEFAFTDPTPCRNPYALERSPGGSSSGSGAAVGAGIVDIALGTQTAGSLCRPAAYCGAVGFKPGLGTLPMAGVTPLSPSFDMVGVIARTVARAEAAFAVMSGGQSTGSEPVRCVGSLILDPEVPLGSGQRAALNASAGVLAERVGALAPLQAPDTERIVADHCTVMFAEAAEIHAHLLDEPISRLLQPKFREALRNGRQIASEAREAALRRLADARTAFWKRHAHIDVILTLPVPEGPPAMGATTGFQNWLTVWTVFGGPLLSLPWGLDEAGLPRSIMLAGRPGDDARLLNFGRTLAAAAPPTPLPSLPAQ